MNPLARERRSRDTRPQPAWRGAATPAAAGCCGFAARGQEGSRGGLLRALRGLRVVGGRGGTGMTYRPPYHYS